MNFFQLRYDDSIADSWEIAAEWLNEDGSWKDVWSFSRGEYLLNPPILSFAIRKHGRVMDWNFCNFNIVVVSKRLAETLCVLAPSEIQLVPCQVRTDDEFFILNILNCVDCLSYERSSIDYGIPGPTVNQIPRGVRNLVVDPVKIGSHQILRLANWTVAIILSEYVFRTIEGEGITGAYYVRVSGS